MPSPDHDPVPDIALGHHPDHGIVAANPKHLASGAWLLEGFGFHPVPGEPTLYALTAQQDDGHSRATQTVALLRKAGYQVHADAAFEPTLATSAAPTRGQPLVMEPDVAFAEHEQLGIVAAIDDRPSALVGVPILEEHGWRHSPPLDIYLLPAATDRGVALEKAASATLSMHRSALHVAMDPGLAQDVMVRHHAPDASSAHGQGPVQTSPTRAIARAASPSRAGTAATAPALAAAASRPVDPRIAFSRNR
ncbi:hypothetical protein AAHZ94_06670 [Streptomyces sp. HSW2009]|uniref:hypothetical protein n=1 Tax=Streptomyces sp. HSW2009 TaxID=3142890 RepID=UPI0032ECD390